MGSKNLNEKDYGMYFQSGQEPPADRNHAARGSDRKVSG